MAASQRKAHHSGECDEVKDFFGVYLLVSHSAESKFKGRTYIGYTVNPNRRIAQHNRGTQAGGAKRTSNKGPWRMALIVHGFPNNISALRFEWSWQQPKVSRRLKAIKGLHNKRVKETQFQHKFRILTEMLRIGPWDRLPLTIRWLSDEYCTDFPPLKHPPLHMIICFGRVITKRHRTTDAAALESGSNEEMISTLDKCVLCSTEIESGDGGLSCINRGCSLKAHSVCLANEFLRSEPDSVLPIEGTCPCCGKQMLWGDLIRRFNGALDVADASDEEEEAEAPPLLCSDVEVSDVSSIEGEDE